MIFTPYLRFRRRAAFSARDGSFGIQDRRVARKSSDKRSGCDFMAGVTYAIRMGTLFGSIAVIGAPLLSFGAQF
jgi:hypothetical protein